MERCAGRLGLDVENVILMGKDCRYYFGDTPLSAGLDEENLNEVEVFQNSDAKSSMISIKWLLKEKKPIIVDVFQVNIIFSFVN